MWWRLGGKTVGRTTAIILGVHLAFHAITLPPFLEARAGGEGAEIEILLLVVGLLFLIWDSWANSLISGPLILPPSPFFSLLQCPLRKAVSAYSTSLSIFIPFPHNVVCCLLISLYLWDVFWNPSSVLPYLLTSFGHTVPPNQNIFSNLICIVASASYLVESHKVLPHHSCATSHVPVQPLHYCLLWFSKRMVPDILFVFLKGMSFRGPLVIETSFTIHPDSQKRDCQPLGIWHVSLGLVNEYLLLFHFQSYTQYSLWLFGEAKLWAGPSHHKYNRFS